MPWTQQTAREAAKKSVATRKRKAEQRQKAREQKKRTQKRIRAGMTIIDAMISLWPEFQSSSWAAWRTFLKVLLGLPLSEAELEVFVKHTGRETPRQGGYTECWNIVGRRGGKSRIAALVAVYLALFKNYDDVLSVGEQGVIIVLAADRRQARTVHGYVRGFVRSVPMLEDLVSEDLKERLVFKNRVAIEIMTASYKSIRGYTALGVVADESAFWRSEDTSMNVDKQVFDAIRPAMATVDGAILLSISTPYAKRGELFRAFDQHYGRDSGVLVWKADTRAMNPTVSEKLIRQAYDRDSEAASAEYGACFRSDVAAYVDPAALAAVIMPGRFELPYEREHQYSAFVDPSGGRADSMTVAIGHSANGIAVLDCVRDYAPPFSPEDVTKEISELVKAYGLSEVTGDAYGGMWPEQEFAKNGIRYKRSRMPKSDLYVAFLPLVNSGQCELLDNRTLRLQMEALDRRTARSGKDSVDHPSGAHDDLANAVAGVLVGVGAPRQVVRTGVFYV